ncbi:hypothetical protein N2152v2_009247 [Parachlorella kessleri]
MASDLASASNAWVASYLDALLSFGLSSEYTGAPKVAENKRAKDIDADKQLYSRYYVRSLLNLEENDLKNAWIKAASATKQGGDKDARLQYLSWRIWFMKRRHAVVQQARKAAEAHEEESVATTEATSEYGSDDEDDHSAARTPRSMAPIAAAAVAELVGSKDSSSITREARGAAEITDVFPVAKAVGFAAVADVAAGEAAAAPGGAGPSPPRPKKTLQIATKPTEKRFDTVFEELLTSGTPHAPTETPRHILETRYERLYVILISLHGLVRGDRMELGRDSDTGGQVKYVVELTKALALHPAVYRVELLTRLIKDPKVDADYGVEEECIAKGSGEHGGAYIVRLPCGPTNQYIRKELLWPYVREFADNGIAHARRMLGAMAEAGRRCELYAVHGHYADAGEVAVLMSCTLDVPMIMTGHSLGRNKLEHLLASGTMTRQEIEETYKIGDRIEAEERCLDHAVMVFTSTQQEIDEQWGLYDGYSPHLARVLRFRRAQGRHMPLMKVNIPEDPTVKEFEQQRAIMAGLDIASTPRAGALGSSSNLQEVGGHSAGATPTKGESAAGEMPPLSPRHPTTPTGLSPVLGAIPHGPRIWQDIGRFLRNPLKPAVLAMSRADPKKNITALVQAFAEHPMLRELANLVLIMGNRDNVDSMAGGSQKVLVQVLKLIDAYDLYGSVAYPKHHTQVEISDIYNFAAITRGVFVNPALQEPFGLTVIEAAAHGVPTVATKNGGPVDIMETLHHGVVVDPTNPAAIAEELVKILTNPQVWDQMSSSGVGNIMAYSWPSHCKRYLDSLDSELKFIKTFRKHDRTLSGLLEKRALPSLGDLDIDTPLASGRSPEVPALMMDRYFSVPPPNTSTMNMSAGPLLGASGTPRKTVSGLSADDMAVLHSLSPEELARTSDQPNASQRRQWVVLTLDSDQCVPEVVAALKALRKSLESAGDGVGIGMLSMLGFDSTRSALQSAGESMNVLDFVVCNSGADMWLQVGGGTWNSDEQYEALIDWQWDRISLHRMLQKIVSQPSAENSLRRLPKLKELLYNVGQDPQAGVHPRHFCLELDPETQAILATGMGPRRDQGSPQYLRSVVDRLKRRLRSRGFRANYNLQLVPQEDGTPLGVLQITPVRASRALALRFLAHRLGLDSSRITVLALAPEVDKGSQGELLAGLYTSDGDEILEGAHRVVVIPMGRPSDGRPALSLGTLTKGLGVSLEPWQTAGDRLVLLGGLEEVGQGVGKVLEGAKEGSGGSGEAAVSRPEQ